MNYYYFQLKKKTFEYVSDSKQNPEIISLKKVREEKQQRYDLILKFFPKEHTATEIEAEYLTEIFMR